MNYPDELIELHDLISRFEDQDEAIKLLLDSPYVIPLYKAGYHIGNHDNIKQYYNLTIRICLDDMDFYLSKIPTSILEKHLNIAKHNFLVNFRFPGEIREERSRYEFFSKIRFIDWYKESTGNYPKSNYSYVRFQIDFEYYKECLHAKFPQINFEHSHDDDNDDDYDMIELSMIRDTRDNRTYNETGVPFSDDAGSEWWESRY